MGGEAEDEKNDAYAWEGAFERSWDNIQENEKGELELGSTEVEEHQHRRLEIVRSVRKGLIRYLFVILDLSKGMSLKDWKPHRCAVAVEILESFVKDYLDQSPISQLGVIGMQAQRASKLSDLSSNPNAHIEQLQKCSTVNGEPSLQNALELARTSLQFVPTYGSREVVVVCGSLTTADPGDLMATVQELKKDNVRVSFIGFGAEMYVLKHIAELTHGTYTIVMDKAHLKVALTNFTVPCPTVQREKSKYSSLIQMGFPERKRGVMSLCICHQTFTTIGYYCPRCKSKYCDLPTTCQICTLPLIASPHLARSYHHLFPVEPFEKIESSENCIACIRTLNGRGYQCPKCSNVYCAECDIYIHDMMHNCIGCLSH